VDVRQKAGRATGTSDTGCWAGLQGLQAPIRLLDAQLPIASLCLNQTKIKHM
jgi:hypothetical protein